MQAKPGGGLGWCLNAATLLRAATIVRNGCDVRNRRDSDTQCTQSTNRGLTTGAWALDLDVQVFDALFLRGTACDFGRHLCGERR